MGDILIGASGRSVLKVVKVEHTQDHERAQIQNQNMEGKTAVSLEKLTRQMLAMNMSVHQVNLS